MSEAHHKRRSSGTVAAQQYRKKADSIEVNTLPMLDALNAQIDAVTERVKLSTPPERPAVRPDEEPPPSTLPEREPESPLPIIQMDSRPDSEITPLPPTQPSARDPRREPPTDPRRDDEIPIDFVEADPFPSKKGTA